MREIGMINTSRLVYSTSIMIITIRCYHCLKLFIFTTSPTTLASTTTVVKFIITFFGANILLDTTLEDIAFDIVWLKSALHKCARVAILMLLCVVIIKQCHHHDKQALKFFTLNTDLEQSSSSCKMRTIFTDQLYLSTLFTDLPSKGTLFTATRWILTKSPGCDGINLWIEFECSKSGE